MYILNVIMVTFSENFTEQIMFGIFPTFKQPYSVYLI